MRTLPSAALSLVFLAGVAAAQSKPAAVTPSGSRASDTTLPITQVSLYKSGVGFFEHTGRVIGSQAVTIDFTSAQLDDVLQTLTAIDRDGGHIVGANYNSTTPLEQQLQGLGLGLGASTDSFGLFKALDGARVEVLGSGAPFRGRLVDIETLVTTPPNGSASESPANDHRVLTVADESGAIRLFNLTPSLTVRLLDSATHADLNRYLELLNDNHSQGLRHLTIQDAAPVGSPTAARTLAVSYLSEVPIWKSTYRILLTEKAATVATHQAVPHQTATLQGWSVIDNTTGTDWVNVRLSLIAGAPQSFIQPLSTPYYARRQEIPLPQEAELTPQTHASGDSAVAKMQVQMQDAAPSSAGVAGISGLASGRGVAGGVLGGFGTMPGQGGNTGGGRMAIGGERGRSFAQPTVDYEQAASASVVPDTTTRAFDDFFAYTIATPVTIRRNQSSLVPILQTQIDAEPVSLWSPGEAVPLRALWITNTSNLTLDRGSFSVVDSAASPDGQDGSFGGEGLLETVHPGERRLLSYAADQAVRVASDNAKDVQQVQQITISKGVLKEVAAEIAEVEYTIHNAAPSDRVVIVEHPRRHGWTLDAGAALPVPDETTEEAYRFRVTVKAGATERLHIGERRILNERYQVAQLVPEQLDLMLHHTGAASSTEEPARQRLEQQLAPVFAAQRALADLDTAIRAKQSAIDGVVNDQARLRENLAALKSTAEERTLAKRYTSELSQQEDSLATLRHELDGLNQQRSKASDTLAALIQGLDVTETL